MAEEIWLTPSQAGAILGVSGRTVNNAADIGLIGCRRTPGGHREYAETVVRNHKAAGTFAAAAEISAKRAAAGHYSKRKDGDEA